MDLIIIPDHIMSNANSIRMLDIVRY